MPARRGRSRPVNPPRRGIPGRTAGSRTLKVYRAKRAFEKTPEPRGASGIAPAARRGGGEAAPRFVVQKHDATRLHYDLRLEVDGVLASWAVPKGPSLDPADKRLAVRTEDHPLDYLTFEGVIPDGQYGAGPMIVWDTGTYENIKEDARGRPIPMAMALERGSIKVRLAGRKLRGAYSLVRSGGRGGGGEAGGKEQWLLIKVADETADPEADLLSSRPESVISGKTIDGLGRRKRTSRTAKSSTSTKPAERHDPRPDWIAPMLATLIEKAPETGEGWVYEHKYDGFRALAFRSGGGKGAIRLLSRNGKGLADRFPEIAEALARQPLEDFIIDGEIVALAPHAAGPRPSFSALQQRLKPTTIAGAHRRGIELRYYIFDLLYAAGRDARGLPFSQRRTLLARAVREEGPIRISPMLSADPAHPPRKLLVKACREGWEGLIAKRSSDPYTSGRSRSWLKLKCSLRQEFVIGGWTDPQGSRTALGSLLLGYYARAGGGGQLLYAGKVGTGFSDAMLRDLLPKLKAAQRKTTPFAPDAELPRRGIHFTTPRLVCEVAFTEWTHSHHIRHPRFLGLRTDKKPAEIVREVPARI
jgi:bifunctional non-homologous end joining protein LigD